QRAARSRSHEGSPEGGAPPPVPAAIGRCCGPRRPPRATAPHRQRRATTPAGEWRTRVSDAPRRAERLVRWYPAAWRARYAEEFVGLLASDVPERPLSRQRNRDGGRSVV